LEEGRIIDVPQGVEMEVLLKINEIILGGM